MNDSFLRDIQTLMSDSFPNIEEGKSKAAAQLFAEIVAFTRADTIAKMRKALADSSVYAQAGSSGWMLIQMIIDDLVGEKGVEANKHIQREVRKTLDRSLSNAAAMRGVRADPPKGAVLELVQTIRIYIAWEEGDGPAAGGRKLWSDVKAALARFRVKDGEGW